MLYTLFDNGITVISTTPQPTSSKTVVVTFDPMHALDISKPCFGEAFILANGIDVVAVQKRKDNWWQDLSVDEFTAATKPVLANYENVFTYGSSMGAYGALYFAQAAEAEALALSPRHPAFYRYYNMPDYVRRFSMTHLPLADVADQRARHLVVTDTTEPIDGPYYQEEICGAFPHLRLFDLAGVGHPATETLNKAGVLKQLALDFFSRRQVNMSVISEKIYASLPNG